MTPGAPQPLILVADDDAAERRLVERELTRRYGADYEIRCCPLDELAAVLEQARTDGRDVALVLAAGARGAQMLADVRARFPSARRGFLLPWLGWADRELGALVLVAMARGWIDLYVLRPTRSRDEVFHRTISELLHESERLRGEGPAGAVVVAPPDSARAHELRAALAGLGIPHRLETGERASVRLANGTELADPTPAELAAALGFPVELGPHDADLVVVGAGPAGLSAAVYASSEGLATTVLDAGAVGGQAGESSLIRNYLGFPRGISGGELAQRAYQQAWLFGTCFGLAHRVVELVPRTNCFLVRAEGGLEVTARAVVLALGVEYRRLDAPGLAELEGVGVYYGASMSEARALAGEDVYVVGAGNSAGQAALYLARYARSVTVLVRGPDVGASMSRYLVDSLEHAPNVEIRTRTEVAGASGDGRLERLELRGADGGVESVPAAGVVILIGARPHTDWLPPEIERDERGFVLVGPTLETTLPGVFAAGDVRSGAVARVVAAAASGALAVGSVHTYLAGTEGRWTAVV